MLRLPIRVALLAALAVVSVAPTAADASYRVGIGDQNAAMFDNPLFQALKIKRVRYIVPWDVVKSDKQSLGEMDLFYAKAVAAHDELLISFNSHRGCYVNNKYLKTSACKAPSAAAFTSAFKAFKKRYPKVKIYSPWNETNNQSQPTHGHPELAARYYDVVRKNCSGCTVVALDVLDQSDMKSYVTKFLKDTKGKPKIFGLHNYTDVNRNRSSGTTTLLKLVPGQVWLTETGGVVNFGSSFPYSLSRAASRTKTMFSLADKYSKKRKGYKSTIARLYDYSFYGAPQGTRFDAGLVNPDGSARPAYLTFAGLAKSKSK